MMHRMLPWLLAAATVGGCTPAPTDLPDTRPADAFASIRLPSTFTLSRLVPPAPFVGFTATSVNAGGTVGGWAGSTATDVRQALVVSPTGQWTSYATVPGAPTDRIDGRVLDVSDDGVGIGALWVGAGNLGVGPRPYVFQAGMAFEAGYPEPANVGEGLQLNTRHTVLIEAHCDAAFLPYVATGAACPPDARSGTFLRRSGTAAWLPSPAGDLNDLDQIATAVDGRPAVWSPESGYRPLALARSERGGRALALNDVGDVVGYVLAGADTVAAHWTGRGSGSRLVRRDIGPSRAVGVNANGVVLVVSRSGNYLWAPRGQHLVALPTPATGPEVAIGLAADGTVIGVAGTRWTPTPR